jgi:proline iminopeptidase
MRAAIRGTEIFFDVEGAGLVPAGDAMVEKPVLFAVHGGPGAEHGGYKPALSPLANKVQIVYFDHRGQGRSARGPKETYTLENNVEDMEALRQYLGLERIVVLGTSYGGAVAMSYAIRYPANVSHLILVATSADNRFLETARQSVGLRGSNEQKKAVDKLLAASFADDDELREYFRIMGPLYSLKYDPVEAEEKLSRLIYSADAINSAFGGFFHNYDIRDQLPKIKAPTLILAGKHDWICPPVLSEAIAEKIPNSDLRVFENSSHSIAADEHEAYLDAIRGFLIYKRSC